MPTLAVLEAILDIFAVHKSELTVSDFILTLLEDSKLQTHLCTLVLVKESSAIITALSRHSRSADSVFAWANGVVEKKYIESIKELTANEEWHFNAGHASAQALNDFRINPHFGQSIDILLAENVQWSDNHLDAFRSEKQWHPEC